MIWTGKEIMTSKSTAFNNWWNDYERTGLIRPVQLGMTCADIQSLFGEPEAAGKGFTRRPLMVIWKFGGIEFHFDADGRLYLIYTEDNDHNPRVIAKDPTRVS
jgi:hypothetical protein